MKTFKLIIRNHSLYCSLILVALLLITGIKGYGEVNSRTIIKDFSANQNTSLTIQHKFGNVDVQNWEKDQISFSVKIELQSPLPKDKADEVLNSINVEFSQSGDQIVAITTFGNESKIPGVTIHYWVNVPKYISLNLSTKYCAVSVNEIDGLANFDIKYGKLSITKLGREDKKPMNQLILEYSNGIIEDAGWLKTEIKYSDLTIRHAQALAVITKYTKLYVDDVNSIASDSEYDTYRIGKIANFVTVAKYADFEFQEVSKKFSIEIKYGNINVKYIPQGFESINIINSYGNISLGIDKNASYKLNGNSNYCSVIVPEPKDISMNEISKYEPKYTFQGQVGLDKQSQSAVAISTNYGNVKLSK